jgi:hypothetical protein
LVAVTAPTWVAAFVVHPDESSVPLVPGTKPVLPIGLTEWDVVHVSDVVMLCSASGPCSPPPCTALPNVPWNGLD